MICLEAPSRVNPRVVTAACVSNATRYRALRSLLLRQWNALTLRRERLDRDALASNGCTAVRGQISCCITCLAVGDADKLILPDESELGSHLFRAGKSSYWIK
jgi:hypothetical protein